MAGAQIDPDTAGAVVDEHYQTSIPGIFSAGNVLHVHDLADFVSLEAEALADSVLEFCSGSLRGCPIEVSGEGCGHVIPQRAQRKGGCHRLLPPPPPHAGMHRFRGAGRKADCFEAASPRQPRGDGAVIHSGVRLPLPISD